jgi:2-hydroxychromene-2-carboxylate isomerase
MVMARLQFLFDFGSPNAFLSHRVVPQIEKRTGVKFEYVPVLLGGIFKATGNKPPMQAFGSVANKMAYERLETERFLRRHAITDFRFNPFFPINTLLLMRMAVAAQMDGNLPQFLDEGCRHMWVVPKKMDDPEVVRAAFIESGLDAERLLSRAQDADVKARLVANTEDAVARGTFGIPTFFVGSEIFFGKDRLRDVEEAIAAVG